MDGLVLDSETGYFAAWRAAAAAMGFEMSLAFAHSFSGTAGADFPDKLRRQFGPDFDTDGFFALSATIWQRTVQIEGIAVKPGLHALLNHLRAKALPFGLATNSRRDDALRCLSLGGLEGVFGEIVSRDDVARPKPAADIYLIAARRLGAKPSDCLVLEDSPVGVTAAVAAGCRCLFVPSCLPADSSAVRAADGTCSDLLQAIEFIPVRESASL